MGGNMRGWGNSSGNIKLNMATQPPNSSLSLGPCDLGPGLRWHVQHLGFATFATHTITPIALTDYHGYARSGLIDYLIGLALQSICSNRP